MGDTHKHPSVKAFMRAQGQSQGFNDCLGYLLLADANTIVHKDFALSRHFRVLPLDLSRQSTTFCDSVANTWQQGLAFLNDGWMIETNVLSEPLVEKHISVPSFPSSIALALLYQERCLSLQETPYLTTSIVLSFTYKPTKEELQQQRWFGFDKVEDVFQSEPFNRELYTFNQRVNDVMGLLSSVLIKSEVLEGDSLVEFLNTCITGEHQDLRAPTIGCFLDPYLAHEDFMAGITPEIGNKKINILALDTLPQESYPMLLDILTTLPFPYRFSSRFIPMGGLTAERYLKRYQRHWSSQAIGFIGVIRQSLGLPVKLDDDAQRTADIIDASITKNRGGFSGFGFYTSVMVLMHEHPAPLNALRDIVKETIQQYGIKVREEKLNSTEAYLGSLPGHGHYNLRKTIIDTTYVSHALPISQPYQGEPLSPCPLAGYEKRPALLMAKTLGNRPFYLNVHVGDVGHTLILGATGGGKSTLVSWIACNHRQYEGSRIIILDKDGSQRLTVAALDGRYMTLGEGGNTVLAPLANCSPTDEKAIDIAFTWLSHAMNVFHVEMTAKRQQILRESLMRLAHEPREFRQLNHCCLEDPALRDALNALNSGSTQTLLNGTKNPFEVNDVIGIDCTALLQRQTLSPQAMVIMDALLNSLTEVFIKQQPTLLIIEEAWLYLKHPVFQATIQDWLKTLRKANVSVLLVSQDIADMANSPCQASLQSACMTRIYCANKAAKEADIADEYRAFGLSQEEIDTIATMQPKQDYYCQSPNGSQQFQLDLGTLAKALLFEPNREKRDAIESLLQHNDVSSWVNFCEANNFTSAIDYLRHAHGAKLEKKERIPCRDYS